jgi:FMN phosphatase YigB (HAD superfamily)
MLPARLRHVDAWIFDLDNSLYPASANLFELIDVRMGQFIQQLSAATRKRRGGSRRAISATTGRPWRA